ncbi:MAG: toll/interleukin-1 receptor domain-containing protein [Pseudomonadota bacterium]
MPTVFFSYSHADEALRDQLEKQLSLLKRQGVIDTWHDRRIGAGQEIDHQISAQIEAADIILLLVSPDFLDSDYCYDREMIRAMERHEAREAIVIPVILRACDWHGAPFGKLLATPTDGRPVTQWPDRDQAFLEVAKAVRGAAERLSGAKAPIARPSAGTALGVTQSAPIPRSSNLRVTKQFTERDKDAFRLETFEFLAKYFENSLQELGDRNGGIEGTYRRIDANRFSAVTYRGGRAVARCTVFMGGAHFSNMIAYSANETDGSNSFNESLTVETDDQMLFLRSMGMSFHRGHQEEKLSQEGAAELYWSMFIEPLQRGQ